MRIEDFDRFLSESNTPPEWIIMHPSVWSGFWSIKPIPKPIKRVFRFLGRKLKNRHMYWIGLPLFWVDGMKEIIDPEGEIQPMVIIPDEWL